MNDKFGRKINYLRLSVTDLCNLRCIYCMPQEGISKLHHEEILSIEEIERIVSAAVDCGIEKVRITGGEPLVRNGIIDICQRVARIKGVRELCLTTNGVLLPQLAEGLREAGVHRLNISLDTLNPDKFRQITRIGRLDDVLNGIQKAKEAGFDYLKLNVVLMGGFNDDEIGDFVDLTRDSNTQIRFIELMPMGQCAEWERSRFLDTSAVLKAVPQLQLAGTEGVARTYRVPGYKGSVGLISPISNHFCPTCNRIRVTSDGKLKACLHSSGEVNLKGLSGDKLKEAIAKAITSKPQSHHLDAATPSETGRYMNQIGG
ncbi:MAG: GTP 3',8-cyclase MoaA [Oscillospiraceae bacterium]|nr:GTP 3',8-cyclase MoaA [Oscillospiraceae bacterium]